LRNCDAAALGQTIKILRPTEGLQFFPTQVGAPTLQENFSMILAATLQALGLSAGEALGTIHLYDDATRALTLAAYCGTAAFQESTDPLPTASGESVLAWVATRRRAILINDL